GLAAPPLLIAGRAAARTGAAAHLDDVDEEIGHGEPHRLDDRFGRAAGEALDQDLVRLHIDGKRGAPVVMGGAAGRAPAAALLLHTDEALEEPGNGGVVGCRGAHAASPMSRRRSSTTTFTSRMMTPLPPASGCAVLATARRPAVTTWCAISRSAGGNDGRCL